MNEQDPIARRAREQFERASGQFDPATAGRLRAVRRAALAASPRRMTRLLPAAAVASILALGLAWWLPRQETAPVPPAASAAGESALVASEEDSEIYAWLSDAPVAPDDGKGDSL